MAVAYVAGLSGTGGWIHVATPQFLSKALGKPQAGAKLVRHPGHGTTLRMGGSSFGISHGDVSFGLAAQGVGSAPWAAYANGVGRPTPFGLETVTANRTQAEQFLTVGRHYGPTTWHWKFGNLPNGVTPRVGDDGYVAFLVQSGSIKQLSQDAFIAPPAILDSHGNRIPQHNLHWTVSSVHGQWWLNLHVDDSHLPTPYVIDPIAMRGTATSSQTSAGTSLVLTAPTGVVANDVMIAQVTTRNNAAISNSAGLTFTQIGSTVTNTANLEQAIYQRVATGSEGGSTATFSWSTGSADATGGILAFSSVNTGVPVDVSTSNTGTTSGTAGTNPCSGTCKATASAVTTNFANDEILVFYGSMGTDNSTAITVTQDSGQNVTQDYTVISTSNKTSRSDSTAAAGTSVQAAAGSTGIFTATLNLGGTPWIAHTVALKPGVATKLAVTSVPANATAGANFSVTVQSQDASGNCTPVNQATGISLASDGTGTLSGNTASISVGTCSVTLSSVQYTKTGTIHLTASRTSGDTLTTSAASSAIVFAAGPVDATQSTLTPTSASITANGSATQVLTVQAKDANGNNLASGGLTVTITKQSGTGSISSVTDNGNGTYTATVTAPSATGSGVFVATLGGNPVKSGGGSQTTSTITYVAGSADATASTLTPTSASITANGTATQVLTVQAKDATGNNLTSGGSTVTITKQSGTGSIGSVTDNGNGTYTATVTAPSATGSGVFVATLGGNPVKSGTGSQAQATVTYAPGTATQLVFGQQPSNTVAGVTMSPAVTVKVEDASGNVVTGDNSTQVALAILNNPSSGTLTGGAATTVSSGIATFSGLSIDKTGVGYTLQATKSGLTSATSNSFNITARTSSVSVSCATNPVTYGGSTLCTATVSDSQGSGTSSTPGGSVAFGTNGSGSFTSSGTCTLSSGSCAVTYTPTAVGTGTHQITATYTSTDGIHGGSNNNTSVTVNKASLTVTPDPQSRTYGQAAPTYTFSVTGFQNGETAGTASGYVAPSCTSDYTTTTNVAASPRTISCSGGSANNYSFNTSATANLTVTKASLTVTPDPQSRTYGQAAPSYTFSVTGFQNGQTAGTASGYVAPSCSSDYTATTNVSASPRTISCSGGSADNYSFSYNTANLTVTKASLSVTPDPQSRTYGQAAPSYTFSVTGFQNSQTAGTASGYVAPSCSSDYTATTNVAASPRTISCSGGSADNYSFSYSTANLTVTKATLTVTPDPQSRTYGQAAPSYTFSVTGFKNGQNAGTASGYSAPSCTSDYTTTTTVAQSPRSISCSGGSADNYSFDTSATASLTVSKASLTVTPDPQSRTYGQAAPSYTFSVTGFVNGQNAGTASGYTAPSCTSDYTATTNVSASPRTISCSGGSADNYSFSYNTANLTVTKAALTVTPDPQSRTYGQAAPSYTFSVTGFKNGETAGTASGYSAPSCTSDYTSTTAVAQSPRTISCSGGSADNYSFDNSATASLTISARALTITASNRSKTYGTSLSLGTTAFTTNGNEANSEQVTAVTLTSTSGNDASTTASVGTYSGDVVPSAATGSNGFLASNYAITYANGDLTITKASFTTSSNVNINGQPAVGKATTVTNGVYSPIATSRSYQWELCDSGGANCSDIAGATGHTYTPVAGDVGSTLKVVETVSRANYNDGTSTSSASAVILLGSIATTTPVAINGTPTVDATSTITPGTYSPTPDSVAYQWQRCAANGQNCSNIVGETSDSYTPVAADADLTVRVVETASVTGYNDGGSTSAAVLVAKAYFTTNTSVAINGTPTVGTPSTITVGTYTPSPAGRLHQWQRCDSSGANCANIAGATGNTYTPVAADVGSRLRVIETPRKAGYNDGSSTSAASPVVVSGTISTSSAVTVNGTPKVGTASTLTAGSYTPAPASSSYQWELCDSTGNSCSNIAGATSSSYTPLPGDVGSTLRVVETVSQSGYNNAGSTSNASPVVIKGNFTTNSAVAINGTPTVGTSTTITNGLYSPAATTRSYQWQLCDSSGNGCVNIAGATSNAYTPVSGDVGSTVRVVETVSRAGYNDGSSTSSAVLVKGIFTTNTAVAINAGTPTVGTQSTITLGTYTPTPNGRAYQWKRCDSSGNNCVNISGAIYNVYTPVAADVGKKLRVVETVSKPNYVNGSSTSAASAVVVKGDFAVTTAVAILGNPKQGVLTKITPGVYSPTPATRTYQWLRCSSTTLASCVNISGATAKTYTPVAGDVGSRLRVVETAHKAGYNNLSVTSAASATVS